MPRLGAAVLPNAIVVAPYRTVVVLDVAEIWFPQPDSRVKTQSTIATVRTNDTTRMKSKNVDEKSMLRAVGLNELLG